MATAHAFRRDLLPPALSFYRNEVGQVSRPNRAGWCLCRCPFHESRSGKSFSVHVDGAFFCFGCGAKGGDIVAFVRMRDHSDFATACKSLGCWQDVNEAERLRLAGEAAKRKQEREQVAQAKESERRQRIQLREEIYTDVAIQAEVSARLNELLKGAEPVYDSEVEDCWHVLSLVLDDLRDCEAGYMSMIGGTEYAG